ncbi:DUF6090 family protein [Ichthyenterobacterium sp. W332]|uniref:DUF6090 family protein n=1 Tax=Microcosmobacter mediterraneus TaxID=3075607 RepID=A0ABU2YJE7_9FLAO|nr:DUF6090 family protein [Ichthyenterobacterium sp. W332]MDT0558289.1 DUF6090 family protein [Ichthyenterobacterium sp. W332]
MIKFFRHFRKSFLDNNQMGKYFKYAIGEILLVVIGILIALQINNWNQNRIADNYEKNVLLELEKTLTNDLDFFNNLEDRVKRKDTAIDNLIFARQGKKKFSDIELKNSIWWANSGLLFSYNKGPYETLKSSGLDKIKSDSLRISITSLYEVTLPRVEAFIQYAEEDYVSLIEEENRKLKEQGFYSEYFELGKNDEGHEGFYIRTNYDLNKYLNEPSYDEMLKLQAKFKKDNWSTMLYAQKETQELLEKVKLELKERFND